MLTLNTVKDYGSRLLKSFKSTGIASAIRETRKTTIINQLRIPMQKERIRYVNNRNYHEGIAARTEKGFKLEILEQNRNVFSEKECKILENLINRIADDKYTGLENLHK